MKREKKELSKATAPFNFYKEVELGGNKTYNGHTK